MATFIQKIKNYLQMPRVSAADRDAYEQMRQAIVKNPDALHQIVEKRIARNHFDIAYSLDCDVKLVLAKSSDRLVSADGEMIPVTIYEGYAKMPDGTFISMFNHKRAELLLKTAEKVAAKQPYRQEINTQLFDGISEYLYEFKQKYNAR